MYYIFGLLVLVGSGASAHMESRSTFTCQDVAASQPRDLDTGLRQAIKAVLANETTAYEFRRSYFVGGTEIARVALKMRPRVSASPRRSLDLQLWHLDENELALRAQRLTEILRARFDSKRPRVIRVANLIETEDPRAMRTYAVLPSAGDTSLTTEKSEAFFLHLDATIQSLWPGLQSKEDVLISDVSF